ncbi:MAG: hypothetical protein NVS3B21_23540 [Acidimicrobiales bacterium]
MAVEVRYESGPFTARNADYLWLLLNVVEGDDEARHVIVRLGPALLEHVWGPRDPLWWFAARAGADHLHRAHTHGQDPPRTIELTADDMRRVLSETKREPEPLVEGVVLKAWP